MLVAAMLDLVAVVDHPSLPILRTPRNHPMSRQLGEDDDVAGLQGSCVHSFSA